MAKRKVRLTSSEFFHTPGMIAMARSLAPKTFNREQTMEFIQIGFLSSMFPTLPGTAIRQLVDQDYIQEGDAILVEFDDSITREEDDS